VKRLLVILIEQHRDDGQLFLAGGQVLSQGVKRRDRSVWSLSCLANGLQAGRWSAPQRQRPHRHLKELSVPQRDLELAGDLIQSELLEWFTSEMATPLAPARPVRPARGCTLQSLPVAHIE